ncbi:hypothetical protein Tco_1499651 [Tanacetum coccineum]
MPSMAELSKSYDCKVTIRSKLHTIPFTKERPDLSESIDSNLVFDIARHTLLFGRRVFSDKAKKLENKASLGKAAKDKAAKGKAAKRKAAQAKAAQPSDKGDTHNVTILDLRSLIWDDEKWKKLSVEDFIRVCLLHMSEQIFMGQEDKKVVKKSRLGLDSNPITQLRLTLKERDENWCRKSYECMEVVPSDIAKDSYEVMKDTSKSIARAQVEETKSTREIALEEKVDSLTSRYVKLEPCYKNLAAYVEIAKKNLPGLSFPTPNAKATSALDENEGPFPTADDNAKATSVRDDVGVPDAAADDNAKAMGVCDDIDEADVAADDNAKSSQAEGIKETHSSQVPIFDVYNTPVDKGDVFMKDARDIINHTQENLMLLLAIPGGPILLKNLNFRIDLDSRVASKVFYIEINAQHM